MDFLIFIGGLILVVIILSTAFGKGVVQQVMISFSGSNPEYLAEEIALLLTTVAHAPGVMKAGVEVSVLRHIKLQKNIDEDDYEVFVEGKVKPLLIGNNFVAEEDLEDQGILFAVRKTNNVGMKYITLNMVDY